MQTSLVEVMPPRGAAETGAGMQDSQETLSVHDLFVRVGMLTRNLHDTLRQLGYDKGVEDAVGSLQDARARLDYIANLTCKAAERVLGAAERAKLLQDQARTSSRALEDKWSALLRDSPEPRALWDLGRETEAHLAATRGHAARVDDELTEIHPEQHRPVTAHGRTSLQPARFLGEAGDRHHGQDHRGEPGAILGHRAGESGDHADGRSDAAERGAGRTGRGCCRVDAGASR